MSGNVGYLLQLYHKALSSTRLHFDGIFQGTRTFEMVSYVDTLMFTWLIQFPASHFYPDDDLDQKLLRRSFWSILMIETLVRHLLLQEKF
jgi:hypothetical protein